MKIVFASGNAGKTKEIQAYLREFDIDVIPQSDLNVIEIEETGLTFFENSLLKARNASQQTNLPALADDSGLVVPALNGLPGIFSARFAGKGCSTQANIEKLLAELKTIAEPQRQAFFYCALTFVQHWQDPTPLMADGRWHGTILTKQTGVDGFGYDPVFYVPSQQKSAAELSIELKNTVSHRGIALQSLCAKLREISADEV
jgi:XTP/dITP diphosphohydrolase